MAQPYIGEIRMFAGNFAPVGWALCDGQLLPISDNEALFTLIGTTYGGDGETTFALPNLQSRFPVHLGQGPGLTQNYLIGETGGVEEVTLTTAQIPTHTHPALGSSAAGTLTAPANGVWAASALAGYAAATADTPMWNQAALPAGGSQPHQNVPPFLVVHFIISLFGIYPSPT